MHRHDVWEDRWSCFSKIICLLTNYKIFPRRSSFRSLFLDEGAHQQQDEISLKFSGIVLPLLDPRISFCFFEAVLHYWFAFRYCSLWKWSVFFFCCTKKYLFFFPTLCIWLLHLTALLSETCMFCWFQDVSLICQNYLESWPYSSE